jgi:murein DD-endopeptidase MepM/ murein hydrolase activator NlpD
MSKWDLPISTKGSFKSYTNYRLVTYNGAEKKLLNSSDCTTDSSTGIRMVDGCYCVALGTYFKKGDYKGAGIGSKFLVTTDKDKQYKVIQCDTKADKDTDSKYHMYTTANNCVTEFYCDTSKMPSRVKTAGSYGVLSQFSGNVIAIELLSNDDASKLATTNTTNSKTKTITRTTADSQKTINTDNIHPYLIYIDRDVKSKLDYTSLKKQDVVGVLLEGGYYFNSGRKVVTEYMNPNLDSQVRAVNKADLSYALYFISRAHSVTEAKIELSKLKLVVNKYPPVLGVWIRFDLTSKKSINDSIVNTYRNFLIDIGLRNKIGIFATKSQLETLTWSKHYDNWVLWWNKHVNNISVLDELLTPEFFILSDGKNHNANPITITVTGDDDDDDSKDGGTGKSGKVTGTLNKPTSIGSYTNQNFPNYSDGSFHGGYDISVSSGTAVKACDGGVVYISKDLTSSYGKYIVIKCKTSNKTYYMIYAHLSKRCVSKGDKVAQGQKIGESGSTGNSTGPHLHLEIRRGGYDGKHNSSGVINPYSYFGKDYSNA